MTAAEEQPAKLTPPKQTRTARELFDVLPELPGYRTEVIEGNLIVSPMGTPEHGSNTSDLHDLLLPLRRKENLRGWVMSVDVTIDGSREPVEPDYVLAPPDCPRWGTRELLSSGLLMTAEVVSPGSARQDREDKRRLYAAGRVPVYLLIDPIAEPPSVTVFSDIEDGAYRTIATVPMGKPIHLPYPVDFEIDTSIFSIPV